AVPAPAAPAPAPAAPAPAAKALHGSLFDELVARCGLSPVIAPSTMTRACRKAGVEPQMLNPVTLAKALPSIRDMLHIFLDAQEAERRIQSIQALAHASSGASAPEGRKTR
ncbi:MAG TPA: hypothetical protein VF697_27080, partial [Archangium sp.]